MSAPNEEGTPRPTKPGKDKEKDDKDHKRSLALARSLYDTIKGQICQLRQEATDHRDSYKNTGYDDRKEWREQLIFAKKLREKARDAFQNLKAHYRKDDRVKHLEDVEQPDLEEQYHQTREVYKGLLAAVDAAEDGQGEALSDNERAQRLLDDHEWLLLHPDKHITAKIQDVLETQADRIQELHAAERRENERAEKRSQEEQGPGEAKKGGKPKKSSAQVQTPSEDESENIETLIDTSNMPPGAKLLFKSWVKEMIEENEREKRKNSKTPSSNQQAPQPQGTSKEGQGNTSRFPFPPPNLNTQTGDTANVVGDSQNDSNTNSNTGTGGAQNAPQNQNQNWFQGNQTANNQQQNNSFRGQVSNDRYIRHQCNHAQNQASGNTQGATYPKQRLISSAKPWPMLQPNIKHHPPDATTEKRN